MLEQETSREKLGVILTEKKPSSYTRVGAVWNIPRDPDGPVVCVFL